MAVLALSYTSATPEMPLAKVETALGIRRWPEAANDQLVGIRRQFAGGAIAQKADKRLDRYIY
jgi:hypothetical protein